MGGDTDLVDYAFARITPKGEIYPADGELA